MKNKKPQVEFSEFGPDVPNYAVLNEQLRQSRAKQDRPTQPGKQQAKSQPDAKPA
jgi:hypothetical protein